MAFDWQENLRLARSLGVGIAGQTVSISFSEATERCAVGRAYYAAFCHARMYAVRHQGFVASGGAFDHGNLAAHFVTVGMPRVSQRLGQLRSWRNQCDYDDVVPNLSAKVRTALNYAADVIRLL